MYLYKFSDTPLSKITDASPSYISEAHRGLELVATLRLPPLAHDARLDHLSTHTGPFVAHPGRFISPPNSAYEWEPFYTAPESRVHVLTADVAHQSFAALYRLVIHNRIFERILEENRQGVYRTTATWDWEEWGPEHTRLFVAVESYRWLRCVFVLWALSSLCTDFSDFTDTSMAQELCSLFVDLHHQVPAECSKY